MNICGALGYLELGMFCRAPRSLQIPKVDSLRDHELCRETQRLRNSRVCHQGCWKL